ncbi:unnamed protein product [Prunus armeniaca]
MMVRGRGDSHRRHYDLGGPSQGSSKRSSFSSGSFSGRSYRGFRAGVSSSDVSDQSDSCRRYIVEGVAPSMPCATDIILGLVSRVPQGAFIVDSRGIIRGVVYRAKCRIHISLWEPLLAMGPKLVRLADEEVSRGDVVEVLEQPTGLVLVGDVFLEVDLIRLDIMDLDVILGMDWLAKHHASVDCFWKEVVFRSPRRLEVSFYEEHRVLPSYLISAMMARWLLRKGCSGYLAHVIDTQDNGLRLEDILVVREFQDVFLEDLLGLPPEWEIEFTIELILRTNPIS